MNKKLQSLSLTLLIGTVIPVPLMAQAPKAGVSQLLQQADYWRGKGRQDLARQAYNRVLAIDPSNAVAKRGLAGQLPPPAQAAATPAPAPAKTAAAKPAPAPAPKPVPQKTAAAPRPVTPTPVAAAPAPKPAAAPVNRDRGGPARAAGFEALQDGKLVLAGTRFKTALGFNPNDSDALGGLGIVRLRSSNFAEARDLLAKASRGGSGEKWAEALSTARFYAGVGAARTALEKGDLPRAEQLAQEQARSGFKDSATAVSLLASVYERQGRYSDAVALYRQLGQAGGTGAQAAGNAIRSQAQLALQSGDDIQAEQLLRDGVSNAPNDAWLAFDLASFLQKRGRYAESDALVRQLASSDDPQPLFAAALVLNQSGRASDAQAVFNRIPEPRRTQEMRDFAAGLSALATVDRAKAMAARGAQGQALAMLRQAGGTPGLTVERKGALAQAMMDLGDGAGATQLAREALSAPAQSAAAYDPVVRVLAKAGQDGLAMSAVQKASTLAGQSADGQQTVAGLNATLAVSQADRLRDGGQFAPAFDVLQTAWNQAPGNQDVMGALGRLYQSGGMYPQAAQTFRMVLAQKPTDKGAMIGLIDSSSSLGDYGEASEATERALRAHGEDYEVYLAAARMAKGRGNEGQAVRYLKRARGLYLRRTGIDGSGGVNPFAGVVQGNNPFRATAQQQQMAQPQTLNPFLLDSRGRPVDPGADAGYGAAPTGGYNAGGGFAPPASYTPSSYQPASAAMTPPGFAPAYPQQQVPYAAYGQPQQAYAAPGYGVPAGYGAPTGYPLPGYGAAPTYGAGVPAYNVTPGYGAPMAYGASVPNGSPLNQQQQRPVGVPVPQGAGPYGYAYSPYGAAPVGDPVLSQIDRDLAEATADSGARMDVQTGYRSRTGETGLSQLREISASAKLSTDFAGGRVAVQGKAVMIDSGRPTGSGLARFGTNGSAEAVGIVNQQPSRLTNADTQHDTGVAPSISYESNIVKAEFGSTPLGFAKEHLTGRAEITPRFGANSSARIWADRKPVTDSIIAYAGTTDPANPGLYWGAVMKSGGGASLSYDKDGTGIYGDVSYYHYDGTAVLDNESIEANVGGYIRAWRDENSALSFGFNANFQNYDNNQNFFTYGHGGYFSPQSFVSVNFPIRYVTNRGPLSIDARIAPGYQSYDQEEAPLYPTEPAAQQVLDTLKSLNTDVRARYDGISKTGFGLAGAASAYYALSPSTRVGGELNVNTFGEYKEFTTLIGVKQVLGGN
ncbi:MAG: cellulose synthase subunit BcsC-related outer membrane protein [Sphingobium sp.]